MIDESKPSILIFPNDVIGKIFEYLSKPSDRAIFAITCKRIQKICRNTIKNQRIPDHEPYGKRANEHRKKVSVIKGIQNKNLCYGCLYATTLTCCCVAGGILACTSGGCCCCAISTSSKSVLGWAAGGLIGGGCASAILVGGYLKLSGDHNERELRSLMEESQTESTALLKEHSNLVIPPPIKMNDYAPSYQNGC